MEKMRYVITGGAGFFGYHLANFLARKKHKVILIDIAHYNKDDYPSSVECYNCDVRDSKNLEKYLNKGDIVVHAAAALPRWKPAEIYDTNIKGTKVALDCSIKKKVSRFIFIATTAVYGIPKKHPIYETDPLCGKEVGPYGDSKAQADKLCEEYRKKNTGMIITTIRPKTFIGTARLGVFQILYEWVNEGRRIPMIGNGNNKYQLLDVDDLVEATYLFSKAPGKKVNDSFNIGAKEFGTIKESINALCKYAGTGARYMATPSSVIKPALALLEFLRLSPLYKWIYGTLDKDSFVSTEKIEKAIGFRPKFSNADALIKSYGWYLEHRKEVRKEPGITHRVAWDQGILKFFKKFM